MTPSERLIAAIYAEEKRLRAQGREWPTPALETCIRCGITFGRLTEVLRKARAK